MQLGSVQSEAGHRDVFISHASEDKADVARPIAEALDTAGWCVWLDEYELTVGDSLMQSINDGLAASGFGVVVLSANFFAKHWPKQELDALAAKEAASGSKVILPVWHGIDEHYLAEVAPMLAGRLGVSTSRGHTSCRARADPRPCPRAASESRPRTERADRAVSRASRHG